MKTVNPWASAPVARLLLPFCCGIIFLYFFPNQLLSWLIAFLSIGAIGFLTAHLFFRRLGYKGRGLPALFLFIALFFSGATLAFLSRPDYQPAFFYKHLKPESTLTVRLTEPVQEKEKSYKALADVVAVSTGGETQAVNGKILLYFLKTDKIVPPAYGDMILLKNQVKPLQSPRNPGEFDYSQHMAIRQVYHMAWLYPGQWKNTGINQGKPIWKAILAYRSKLEKEIEFLIRTPEEQGIAKAILLGEDKELDAQTRAAYTGTGTLHVLSVSGMHVGILFIALRFLLSFFLGARLGRVVRMAILLGFLWGYALLTGLSPSVARSAAMLSLVLVGLEYKGATNIYNIIAASAFVLLLTDPYLIAHVSFQLSYTAILGIIWLQPMIARHWEPKGWVLKQGWEIIAASIAAQVTTLPIALLYFNQFPSYFLLSNLVIIPISSMVLIIGSFWLVLATIPGISIVASVAGFVTYGLINAMNASAKFLSALPAATLNGLYIDKMMFVLMCATVLLICFAYQYRRKSLFWSAGIFAVLFFADLFYSRYQSYSINQLTIHAINKKAALTVKTGNRLYMLSDSAVLYDPDMQKYHFQGFINSQYISDVSYKEEPVAQVNENGFYYRRPFGQFADHKFLWLSDKGQLEKVKPNQSFDFLILSANTKITVGDLQQRLRFKRLILTADNSTYRTKKWEEECRGKGIPCSNLKKDYSFIISN